MLELPFGLTIDWSFWSWFINLPIPEAARVLLALGGWVLLAFFFLKAGAELWAEYREKAKYTKNWNWVLLAVDVPALFIQTPKAVEQIFAHLSGALAHINVADKFWRGKKQKWFSFEIISIEGYIQFLIRTEAEFRDLVEASIYAQYTEAEITEVEDYVENIPDAYPHADYDVMGAEFKLSEADAYPIRVYPEFQYNLSKDAVFSDPMAAILENFSRIGRGENLWMQLIVEPVGGHWKEEGIELAKELMGQSKSPHGPSLPDTIMSFFHGLGKELLLAFFGGEASESHDSEHEDKANLTPGMKDTVELIEHKIDKIGFKSKMRVLYAAEKSVFNPSHCLEGFIGAMNQFHQQNRNGLVPFMSTRAHYDASQRKSNKLKNSFVKVFKKRKMKWKTCNGYILNIEELATIWHFPLPFVKTPLLSKAGYKRAEAPPNLPVESSESPLKRRLAAPAAPEAPVPAPPEELPFG